MAVTQFPPVLPCACFGLCEFGDCWPLLWERAGVPGPVPCSVGHLLTASPAPTGGWSATWGSRAIIQGSDLQAHPAQDAGAQNGKKKGKGSPGLDAGACWQGDQRGFVGRLRGDAGGTLWGQTCGMGHLLTPPWTESFGHTASSFHPGTLIAVSGSGAPLGTASSFL